jgi:hypothetical protein
MLREGSLKFFPWMKMVSFYFLQGSQLPSMSFTKAAVLRQFVLLITFLCKIFETFSTDLKSAWNSAYFRTHIEYSQKKLFTFISTNKTLEKLSWQKNQKRYQNTQNLTLISNPLKKLFKNIQKKIISKNLTKICTFSTFTHVRQTCFAYYFFWWIF